MYSVIKISFKKQFVKYLGYVGNSNEGTNKFVQLEAVISGQRYWNYICKMISEGVIGRLALRQADSMPISEKRSNIWPITNIGMMEIQFQIVNESTRGQFFHACSYIYTSFLAGT